MCIKKNIDLKEYRNHINKQLEKMSDEEFEDLFEGIECIRFINKENEQMIKDIVCLLSYKKALVDADVGIKWTEHEKEIASRYNIEI